ncbi:MAG: iron-containing alcohol dehydrogenase [Burkholderiales bacterium]|nr:iron-containing alcohol dehydrogenase [Burkholderiales bacterium]
MGIAKFAFPTTIHFGAGASKLVGDHLRAAGVKRPVIVTDKGLAALPMLAAFRDGLGAGLNVAVFSGIWGNPTAAQVREGAKAARTHGADGVIGFGGGAALDVAKLVALMTTHDGDVMEYVWDHPKVRSIDGDLPHFIALPTTSGTGSEVGRSSVVSEDDTHVKRVVFSPRLLAKAVFADPALTLGLPAGVTAATGMDAMTHNIESYLCPSYHPMCDGIALEGIRIAARALPIAVRDPGNLEARGDMMMASMMGAVAFQKDLGAVHACAHALSAVADLHHGLANALMIEPVMHFNLSSAPEKFAEMAHVVGAAGAGDFVPWLKRFKAEIGIPASLAAVKVTAAQSPALVEIAEKDICHQTNPRPCTRGDFVGFFEAAL